MSRYKVIRDGVVLFSCDTTEKLDSFIQGDSAKDIEVFQKIYVAETVLLRVSYEDDIQPERDKESEVPRLISIGNKSYGAGA